MHEVLQLAAALAAGMVLGAMFFGGLWWTVMRGVSSHQPALWFLFSKVLRMALALGGFYLVGGVRWERWLACLLGFVVARLVVARLTRPPTRRPTHSASRASYAP